MSTYNIKSIFVETTSRCNLFCKHCYNSSGALKNKFIDINIIEGLFEKSKEYNIPKISISGGEPLLHPDIDRILLFSKKYEIDSQIITNGTLLKSKIDKIIGNSWTSVQVSVDGDAYAHNRLRGDNSYEKMEEGVKCLKNNGKKWSLKCTINRYNFDVLENVILFGIANGAYVVSFSLLNLQGRAKYSNIELSQKECVEICEKMEYFKDKYSKEIVVECPKMNYNNICPFTIKKDSYDISPRIDVNGNVFLCSIIDNIMFSLGNINSENIYEIINSNRTNDIVDFFCSFAKINNCRNCLMNNVCAKGCPGTFFNKFEAFSDDYCSTRKYLMLRNIIQEYSHDNI